VKYQKTDKKKVGALMQYFSERAFVLDELRSFRAAKKILEENLSDVERKLGQDLRGDQEKVISALQAGIGHLDRRCKAFCKQHGSVMNKGV